MKNILLVITLAFLFIGCAKQKIQVIHVPALHENSMAEVGENMFERYYSTGGVVQYDKVILDAENTSKYQEDLHLRVYTLEEGKNETCSMVYFYKSDIRMGKSNSVLLDNECDGKFDEYNPMFMFSDIVIFDNPIPYKIEKSMFHRNVSSGSFKREVIYQGKVGNKINIQFREFAAVRGTFLIRDGFTQNIQYELDEKGEAIVGFMGLRLKVLKATNHDIVYEVLQDYKN